MITTQTTMTRTTRVLFLAAFLILAGCAEGEHSDKDDDSSKSSKVEYLTGGSPDASLPFSPAVRVGNTLYLSGQIGNFPGTLDLAEGGMEGEAHQTMQNIKATLERFGSSLDHVVKCLVMIDDISLWGDFNTVYVQYFPGHKPARSAFGAEGLALGAAVEVECIAIIP